MTQQALQLSNITKTFGALTANDNISLELNCGEILALLGENGAGKTTLMNILFGHYTPDNGSIKVFNKPLVQGSPQAALESGIGMVHQHFTLADNMTALDNITLGTESLFSLKRSKKAARAKISELADKFGLHVEPDAKIRNLSVGQQQKVEILKALYRDVKILILDEPTAVLTPQESETLFSTLRLLVSDGLAVIFITHKLKEVISGSDKCAVLRHGKVVYNTDTRDTNIDQLAEAMVGGTIQKASRQKVYVGEELLKLKDISVASHDQATALKNIDLKLHGGEILGIAGVSGNGQNKLAELLSGIATAQAGTIHFKHQPVKKISPKRVVTLGFGRIPEDRNHLGLIGDMSIEENCIAESYKEKVFNRFGFLKRKSIRKHTTKLIEQFDIRCPGPKSVTRTLSGGNMQKLILARALDAEPEFILANQPTWGLDVGATSFVHSQLLAAREKRIGILLISEDLDEILQIADRIQVIYQGRLTPPVYTEDVTAAAIGRAMSGHSTSISDADEVVQ